MKPILFNTDMVRAILEDRKTTTRRAIKPQPDKEHKHKFGFCVDSDRKNIGKFGFGTGEEGGNIFYAKPPCRIGDVLYVRETWAQPAKHTYWYKADNKHQNMLWRTSIHMPKEAARIFLEVTDVRVERLQDITEAQAIQEGTPYEMCGGWKPTYSDPDSGGPEPDFINGFARLWDSTIQKSQLDQYGWEANPWVWVIEFKRTEKPEREDQE